MQNGTGLGHLFIASICQPPRLEGIILYEDFACGLRLKATLDQAFAELFGRVGWGALYHLSLWDLRMLRSPVFRALVSEESEKCALFCLAASQELQDPQPALLLTRHWLTLKQKQPCTLLMAGFEDSPVSLEDSRLGLELRQTAERAGSCFVLLPLLREPHVRDGTVDCSRTDNFRAN